MDIYETQRIIKLKHREYQTPQGCLVESTWYTDLVGIVTEAVVLSTKPAQVKSCAL